MSGVLSLPYVLALLAVLSLGRVIYTAIYNLYFHPLSKFPGPRLFAASRLPIALYRVSGRQVFLFKRLHQQYGYNVRVAPGELSTISPSAWKEIYGHRIQGHGGYEKDFRQFYTKDPLGVGAEMMIHADFETHSRQRRIFANAFSDKALRDQEPLLKEYTGLMIEKLGDCAEAGNKADMVDFYNFVAFDTIADLTFGEPLHLLDNMEYNPWIRDIFAGVKHGAIIDAFRSYAIVGKMLKVLMSFSALKKKRETHIKFCTERVDRRLQLESNVHPDFWTLVEQAEEKGKGLSLAEMHVHGVLFMTAGTETTATLLCGLTYLLCTNQETLDRLASEVRGAFDSVQQMSLITLPKLKYLNACIEEGLRFYPPAALGMPRVVPPEGGILDGHELPPNQTVYFYHYAAYHSELNFAYADEFHPERFFTPPPAEFANDRFDCLNPFSTGPRNCIGKNLAYHEMRLILARLVWTFDIELCPESNDWMNHKMFTLWEKPSLWLNVKKVERNLD